MTVRMSHPRLGTRDVQAKVVEKLRQNGWSVVEDEPPKPKRRSKVDDAKPPEDSGGSSMTENDKE